MGSLDFLIVGAIASVDVYSLGHVWEVFCVLVISPIMHPTHWFEGGICVYGQDTGVIAAGLMLLKMVDPESKTPIPAAFGYKQPLHSAIIIFVVWFLTLRPQFKAIRKAHKE